jgi:hypothetical protein
MSHAGRGKALRRSATTASRTNRKTRPSQSNSLPAGSRKEAPRAMTASRYRCERAVGPPPRVLRGRLLVASMWVEPSADTVPGSAVTDASAPHELSGRGTKPDPAARQVVFRVSPRGTSRRFESASRRQQRTRYLRPHCVRAGSGSAKARPGEVCGPCLSRRSAVEAPRAWGCAALRSCRRARCP